MVSHFSQLFFCLPMFFSPVCPPHRGNRVLHGGTEPAKAECGVRAVPVPHAPRCQEDKLWLQPHDTSPKDPLPRGAVSAAQLAPWEGTSSPCSGVSQQPGLTLTNKSPAEIPSLHLPEPLPTVTGHFWPTGCTPGAGLAVELAFPSGKAKHGCAGSRVTLEARFTAALSSCQ